MNFRIVSLFLSCCFVFSSCGESGNDGKRGMGNSERPIPAVEAVKARFGSLPLEERLSGVVVAYNQVDIFPQVTGPVAEILVKDGDRVQKGQVLLRLRDTEFKQRIRQAESGYDIAKAQEAQAKAALDGLKSQLRRTLELKEKNLASDLELETLQAQVAGAEANYDLAKARSKQSYYNLQEQKTLQGAFEITSPISGKVGNRTAEVGQLVNPNSRLFVVGDLDRMIVRVVLTEKNLSYVTENQSAIVTSENHPNKPIQAVVSRISPFLNPQTHTTMAEIDIVEGSSILRPGMYVSVDILYGKSELATLIPNAALYKDPRTGIEGVFVAESIGKEVEPAQEVSPDSPPPYTEPTPMTFIPVKVVARGRSMSGVSGIKGEAWVVTIGQNILSSTGSKARVRAIEWNRVLDLQDIKEADLLDSLVSAVKMTYPTNLGTM